jgi:plasmid stabilization system protein ParE
MNYRVVITNRALEDLSGIRDFIAKRSPDVKPYRILFTVSNHRVEIMHVRHGARLPAQPEDLV